MPDRVALSEESLPLDLELRIEALCGPFEAAWKDAANGGTRPRIEDYLAAAAEAERGPLFRELLKVELHYRRGEAPAPDEYRQRFPGHERLLGRLFEEQAEGEVPSRRGEDTASTRPDAPDQKPARRTPAPGDGGLPTIPGYEILGEIGRGGMGVVYKARQRVPSRLVALKMILAGPHASAGDLDRFRREADAVARLQHPNIVQIYEVGEADGRPYCALEYVEGASLGRQLRGTPLPPRRAAQLVETLARAVHHAHQHDVVHRDLKPDNILLIREGQTPGEAVPALDAPKITDFGLAKRLDVPTTQTQSGVIIGTPSYMAPEQATGKPQAIGPRTDVYGLGAILYELLTGRPPFRAATDLDTVLQVIADEPVRPSRLQPKTPRDLETVCLKCLQKEPPRRYASAVALAEDLQRFLKGEPIKARPAGALERGRKWARRRPAVAALLALLVLVTATGFALVTWKWYEAEQARQETKRLVVRLSLGQGQSLCERGDVGAGMLRLADTLVHAAEDSPDFERAIRANLAAWGGQLFPLQRLVPHPGEVRLVASSPDGQTLLTVADDNRVRLWRTASGEPVGHPLKHPQPVLAAAFSPDGNLVLTGCTDGKARLWEAATDRPLQSWDHGHPVRVAVFSPDGRAVVTGSDDGKVRLWDIATERLLHVAETESPVLALAFGPGGKVFRTATGSKDANGDGVVRLWEATTGKAVAKLRQRWGIKAVAFSPDGRTVLTGGEDHSAQLWETATGRFLGKVLQHQDTVVAVAFSPDGQTLLTGSQDWTARLWEAATGRPLGPPLEHGGPVSAVAFGPGGDTVLTASDDHTARLWKVAWRQPHLREFRHDDEVLAVAFTTEHEVLTASGHQAQRWDVANGKQVGPPLSQDDDIWTVAFNSGDQSILTGSRDGQAVVWDPASAPPKRFRHGYRVRSVAFCPGSEFILTGGGDMERNEGEAWLWDTATGRHNGEQLGSEAVWAVAVSPDGKTCAIASGKNAVRLWDIRRRTARDLRPHHQTRVVALAFSPDGGKLLTGSTDKTARLWDTATGAPLGQPLPHPGTVWAVAFSHDGRTMVTGGGDGNAYLWDTATGASIGKPWSHQGVVWAVACHIRNGLVLTGSRDKTARLWQIPEPLGGTPEQVRLWTEVITGMELDHGGSVQRLDASAWQQRRQRLLALGGPPLP
jgi:WD40 repeat protein